MCSIIVGIIRGVFPRTIPIIFAMISSLNVACTLLAIIVYTIIFFHIRASRLRFASGRFLEFYTMAGMIAGTTLMFYMIPTVAINIISSDKHLTRGKCLLNEGLVMLFGVGLMSDALIYVFLQKEFREVVFGWFCFPTRNVTPRINQYNTNNDQRVTTNV